MTRLRSPDEVRPEYDCEFAAGNLVAVSAIDTMPAECLGPGGR